VSKKIGREDPIEQWKEWLDNRYNPGYVLGGRIHPGYRAKGKSSGVFLLISGVMGLSIVLLALFAGEDRDGARIMFLLFAIISVVTIFAGLTMIVEGKKKSKGR